MRNHNDKFDRYECGEGNHCHIPIPLIAAGLGLAGSALGFLGSREQSNSQEAANEQNAPQYYGPGLDYVPGLLGDAQSIYGQQGFAPPANPLEMLGRQNQLGYAEGALPGMIGSAQQSWMQGLDPSLNPYVGMMIQAGQNDLAQEFQRNVLPFIADQAQAVGGYGGARQGVAQGIAAEGLLEAQGDLSARLLSDAYGQGLNQQQAAWQMAPNMLNMGFLPSQTQQQVGGLYRQDEALPAANLAGFAGMVSPFVRGSQGSAAQPLPSSWGGAFNGLGMGLNLANQYGGQLSGLFSPTPPYQGTQNQLMGSPNTGTSNFLTG